MNAPVPDAPPLPVLAPPKGGGWRPRLAFRLLRLLKWRVVLAQPVPPKAVVVFYPHTANADFALGLLAKWAVGLDFRWVGKHTLFATPLAPWFVKWGGIPVDRAAAAGFVDQLAAAFAASDRFLLVISPEGTRSRTQHWKSGFYRLARAAGVPVGLGFLDVATRTIGVGGWLDLTGDVDRDLAAIRAFYETKVGRNPRLAGPIRFRDAGPVPVAGETAPRTRQG